MVNKNGIKLHTYRMNNVPFYEHKYLAWQNLDHCNGWAHDKEYLNTAVQKELNEDIKAKEVYRVDSDVVVEYYIK